MCMCIKTWSTAKKKRKVILGCGWELGKMAYGWQEHQEGKILLYTFYSNLIQVFALITLLKLLLSRSTVTSTMLKCSILFSTFITLNCRGYRTHLIPFCSLKLLGLAFQTSNSLYFSLTSLALLTLFCWFLLFSLQPREPWGSILGTLFCQYLFLWWSNPVLWLSIVPLLFW